MAAVYVKQAGQADKIYYAHTDHLGSIVKLTDANGAEVFKASYDAWGKQTVSNNTFNFHRGYTGHEHLPEFGLVNMNGRMYDPILGRMLSPDPYVADPDFSQDFNRYSYARNNPLAYTDPDGEWIIAAAILVVFTYLKTAHDQTPADKNDGNPANWAWNPVDWFKKSDDPSQPPSPPVTVTVGYSPGSGVTVGGGIGNPAGPVPMFGYSSGGGPSIGIYNNGLTSWYSSGNNPSAPEQNANRAIESAREAAYSNEIWATTFFPPAGTQVMEPLSGWGMVGNLILGPRTYNGRIVDWDGRITANHAPITGMAPTPGFKGGFGNIFKGGSQKLRDATIKQYPTNFVRWYHRFYKGNNRKDATSQELKELYQEWVQMGKPNVK